jgi:IS5 family transposase
VGRVYRDISRKATKFDPALSHHLHLIDCLLKKTRDSKEKLYSIHEPEVECISKGKAHKRYEFGVKVGMATTSKGNWIVGIQAYPGNSYDGHTLEETLKQVTPLTRCYMKEAYVDKGYRGHEYEGDIEVHIIGIRRMNQMTSAVRKWLRYRNAIVPILGYLKFDNQISGNYLKGSNGDQINNIFSGCGFNMRKRFVVISLS